MNKRMAISNKILPAILCVRSSLSNCFTSTVSSFSCFNWSASTDFAFEDFSLFAIGNKDIENQCCKYSSKKRGLKYVKSLILCRFEKTPCQ